MYDARIEPAEGSADNSKKPRVQLVVCSEAELYKMMPPLQHQIIRSRHFGESDLLSQWLITADHTERNRSNKSLRSSIRCFRGVKPASSQFTIHLADKCRTSAVVGPIRKTPKSARLSDLLITSAISYDIAGTTPFAFKLAPVCDGQRLIQQISSCLHRTAEARVAYDSKFLAPTHRTSFFCAIDIFSSTAHSAFFRPSIIDAKGRIEDSPA
uniref:Helicase ATP-binding domain-containing protein n=1 Tax=Steinernema glaseri TaxID=37863 RepID=A0A1I8AP95_9BILA